MLHETEDDKVATERFRNIIEGYQMSGFSIHEKLQDPDQTFCYPLLHWAAVLGKVNIVKLLIQKPFNVSPIKTSHRNRETALHRLFVLWDDHIDSKTFLELITALKTCIVVKDSEGRTPFHLCGQRLVECTNAKERKLWKDALCKMVNEVSSMDYYVDELLNYQDKNGRTLLHTLVKQDKLIRIVEYIVSCGADIGLENNRGETAKELAWRYSLSIYNLLMKVTLKYNSYRCVTDQEKRTRASQGLSETIDYTQFFEENDMECDLNESDISEIEEEASPVKTANFDVKHDVSKIDDLCASPKHKRRKRYCIMSDSDNSEDEKNITRRVEKKKNISKDREEAFIKKPIQENYRKVTFNLLEVEERKIPHNSPAKVKESFIEHEEKANCSTKDSNRGNDELKRTLCNMGIPYKRTQIDDEIELRNEISDVIKNIKGTCEQNGYDNQPIDEYKIPEQTPDDIALDEKIKVLQTLLTSIL